jgi:hypothetical protein
VIGVLFIKASQIDFYVVIRKFTKMILSIASNLKVNHFRSPATRAIIRIIARTVSVRRILIQMGESTQIHGQLMYPVSFRPINRTVNRPVNPIPLEEEDEEDMNLRFVFG